MLKICLVVEEALIRWQERFGEEHKFKIYMRKWFSAPKVVIRLADEPFNPLKNDIADDESIFSNDVMNNLLHYDEAKTIYRYENGYNELISFSTKERKPIKIPGGSITISILLAVICSFMFGFLSQDVQNILINEIVSPLLSSLMNLIITITVFMMFFSIVSSICAIEGSITLSNIGFTVIGRLFLLSLMIIAFTMAISEIFFPVIAISGESSIEIGKIIELLLSIIPTNIIAAFSEANILQVTILASLTGICITIIGNQIPNAKNFFIEMNKLIFKIMELVLKVIPLIIFLCIFKTLSTTSFSDFLIVWKILVANYITAAIVAIFMLIRLQIKSKMSISQFLKKMYPVFIIALTTGSSIAVLPKTLEAAKNELHIEEKFSMFCVPLAVALFSPHFMIVIVVATFYATAVSGGTLSLMQLLIVAFLAIQIVIALPKIAGAMAIGYGILLAQLDLPLEFIGTLMIADVMIDNAFTVLTSLTHNCELVSVAHKLNFIKTN